MEQRTFQAHQTKVACAPRWRKLCTFKKPGTLKRRRGEVRERAEDLKGLEGQVDVVLAE